MSQTAFALLGIAAWSIFLLLSLGIFRSLIVLGGSKAANAFSPSGEDLDGFGHRLTRAHANCYEFLPIAGILMLYAIATGQDFLTDGLAIPLLVARIAQSIVHLISTNSVFVMIRFLFFISQAGILIFWLAKLFGVV